MEPLFGSSHKDYIYTQQDITPKGQPPVDPQPPILDELTATANTQDTANLPTSFVNPPEEAPSQFTSQEDALAANISGAAVGGIRPLDSLTPPVSDTYDQPTPPVFTPDTTPVVSSTVQAPLVNLPQSVDYSGATQGDQQTAFWQKKAKDAFDAITPTQQLLARPTGLPQSAISTAGFGPIDTRSPWGDNNDGSNDSFNPTPFGDNRFTYGESGSGPGGFLKWGFNVVTGLVQGTASDTARNLQATGSGVVKFAQTGDVGKAIDEVSFNIAATAPRSAAGFQQYKNLPTWMQGWRGDSWTVANLTGRSSTSITDYNQNDTKFNPIAIANNPVLTPLDKAATSTVNTVAKPFQLGVGLTTGGYNGKDLIGQAPLVSLPLAVATDVASGVIDPISGGIVRAGAAAVKPIVKPIFNVGKSAYRKYKPAPVPTATATTVVPDDVLLSTDATKRPIGLLPGDNINRLPSENRVLVTPYSYGLQEPPLFSVKGVPSNKVVTVEVSPAVKAKPATKTRPAIPAKPAVTKQMFERQGAIRITQDVSLPPVQVPDVVVPRTISIDQFTPNYPVTFSTTTNPLAVRPGVRYQMTLDAFEQARRADAPTSIPDFLTGNKSPLRDTGFILPQAILDTSTDAATSLRAHRFIQRIRQEVGQKALPPVNEGRANLRALSQGVDDLPALPSTRIAGLLPESSYRVNGSIDDTASKTFKKAYAKEQARIEKVGKSGKAIPLGGYVNRSEGLDLNAAGKPYPRNTYAATGIDVAQAERFVVPGGSLVKQSDLDLPPYAARITDSGRGGTFVDTTPKALPEGAPRKLLTGTPDRLPNGTISDEASKGFKRAYAKEAKRVNKEVVGKKTIVPPTTQAAKPGLDRLVDGAQPYPRNKYTPYGNDPIAEAQASVYPRWIQELNDKLAAQLKALPGDTTPPQSAFGSQRNYPSSPLPDGSVVNLPAPKPPTSRELRLGVRKQVQRYEQERVDGAAIDRARSLLNNLPERNAYQREAAIPKGDGGDVRRLLKNDPWYTKPGKDVPSNYRTQPVRIYTEPVEGQRALPEWQNRYAQRLDDSQPWDDDTIYLDPQPVQPDPLALPGTPEPKLLAEPSYISSETLGQAKSRLQDAIAETFGGRIDPWANDAPIPRQPIQEVARLNRRMERAIERSKRPELPGTVDAPAINIDSGTDYGTGLSRTVRQNIRGYAALVEGHKAKVLQEAQQRFTDELDDVLPFITMPETAKEFVVRVADEKLRELANLPGDVIGRSLSYPGSTIRVTRGGELTIRFQGEVLERTQIAPNTRLPFVKTGNLSEADTIINDVIVPPTDFQPRLPAGKFDLMEPMPTVSKDVRAPRERLTNQALSEMPINDIFYALGQTDPSYGQKLLAAARWEMMPELKQVKRVTRADRPRLTNQSEADTIINDKLIAGGEEDLWWDAAGMPNSEPPVEFQQEAQRLLKGATDSDRKMLTSAKYNPEVYPLKTPERVNKPSRVPSPKTGNLSEADTIINDVIVPNSYFEVDPWDIISNYQPPASITLAADTAQTKLLKGSTSPDIKVAYGQLVDYPTTPDVKFELARRGIVQARNAMVDAIDKQIYAPTRMFDGVMQRLVYDRLQKVSDPWTGLTDSVSADATKVVLLDAVTRDVLALPPAKSVDPMLVLESYGSRKLDSGLESLLNTEVDRILKSAKPVDEVTEVVDQATAKVVKAHVKVNAQMLLDAGKALLEAPVKAGKKARKVVDEAHIMETVDTVISPAERKAIAKQATREVKRQATAVKQLVREGVADAFYAGTEAAKKLRRQASLPAGKNAFDGVTLDIQATSQKILSTHGAKALEAWAGQAEVFPKSLDVMDALSVYTAPKAIREAAGSLLQELRSKGTDVIKEAATLGGKVAKRKANDVGAWVRSEVARRLITEADVTQRATVYKALSESGFIQQSAAVPPTFLLTKVDDSTRELARKVILSGDTTPQPTNVADAIALELIDKADPESAVVILQKHLEATTPQVHPLDSIVHFNQKAVLDALSTDSVLVKGEGGTAVVNKEVLDTPDLPKLEPADPSPVLPTEDLGDLAQTVADSQPGQVLNPAVFKRTTRKVAELMELGRGILTSDGLPLIPEDMTARSIAEMDKKVTARLKGLPAEEKKALKAMLREKGSNLPKAATDLSNTADTRLDEVNHLKSLPDNLKTSDPVLLSDHLNVTTRIEHLTDQLTQAKQDIEHINKLLEQAVTQMTKTPDVGARNLFVNPKELPPLPVTELSEARITTGTEVFYHGTRVQDLQLNSIDPIEGAARSEFGVAVYLSRSPEEAYAKAQADVSRNLPPVPGRTFGSGEVHEVTMGQGRLLHHDQPLTEVELSYFKDAAKAVWTGLPYGSVAKGQLTKKLKGGATVRQAYDALSSALTSATKKLDLPVEDLEATMLSLQRMVNDALLKSGVDGIDYGQGLALFNTKSLTTVARKAVEEGSTLDHAIGRLTSDSLTAGRSSSELAQAAHAESKVRALSELQDQAEEVLEDTNDQLKNLLTDAHQLEAKMSDSVKTKKQRAKAKPLYPQYKKELNNETGGCV